jgi:hypothetical protein
MDVPPARVTVRGAVQSSHRLLRDTLAAFQAGHPDITVVGKVAEADGIVALCELRQPLAVAAARRRDHISTALCEHAFADMTENGVEVVTIGTGGSDSFHAPARALYESLGCVPVHVAVYFKQL